MIISAYLLLSVDAMLVSASHRRSPDSIPGQCVWDLRCTMCHWDGGFSKYFLFPCQYHSISVTYPLLLPTLCVSSWQRP